MMNEIMLIGNVGQSELKVGQTGTAILNFSVATSHSYKDKNEEWVNKTTWHNVVVFGKTAEGLAKRLESGHMVLVKGRLEIEKYETKDGGKATSVKVLADNVKVLKKKGEEGEEAPAAKKTGSKPAPAPKKVAAPEVVEDFGDDGDIPF